ncbi:MAG: PIN domain-containing protein [Vicinamibacterales bacterium]|nr:PIN domain-containing protein [Vicinamibacterales bacterium]RUA05324.1 MAG: VapC toxin family PIN domain ribonuclease [Candidatus Neomarinimicrobiota bacterium]
MTSTLVDTSVWVDHLRHGNDRLASLLDEGSVLCHPFVIGELACGNLADRDRVLHLLGALPETPVASHEEVMALIRSRELHGKGLGWIDVHLLASALLAKCPLWTMDKTLHSAGQTSRFGPVRL